MNKYLFLFQTLWIFAFSSLLTGIAYADVNSHALKKVPNISSSVNIDGNLDEEVWDSALEIHLTYEVSPGDNIEPPVSTRALLFENGTDLFIAFEAKDDNPEKIRAYLSDRDAISGTDRIIVKLDTFNDSRTAFEFSVNALGIQADSLYNDQNSSSNDDWDAIWYSAGQITANGYNVEMRIPYNALRFTNSNQLKTWGISLNRLWPRNFEHQFADTKNNRNINCQPCQFQKVEGFESAKAPSNFTIIPSLTVVQSDSRDLQTSQWSDNDAEERASLDIRWGVNQNTYFNATINPDFSQVEADSLQLDVNNLSALYLSEKRTFFLDGSEFFNNWSRLVYTRIFEEPKYGLKLTGKEGDHSYGLMSVEDKHLNLFIPYQYGVESVSIRNLKNQSQIFSYRYDLGEKSNIGATITSRRADDYKSTLLAIDGKYWLNESNALRFQALNSNTENSQAILDLRPDQKSRLDDQAFSVSYLHNSRNWDSSLTYHKFGKDFRADTGYISFSNWQKISGVVNRIWYVKDKNSWWKKISFENSLNKVQQIDGVDIENLFDSYINIEAGYNSEFGFGGVKNKKTYITSDIIQNETEFDTFVKAIWLGLEPAPDLYFYLDYQWGKDIDYSKSQLADIKTFNFEMEYQITNQWSTELEYIHQTLSSDNIRSYKLELGNFRTAYQIDENSFVRLTLQARALDSNDVNYISKRLASQLIYSYKINPFTLFYIGYSDNFKTNTNTYDLTKTNKTLFVKFSYAWQL